MKENAIIGQFGGPTSVINSSVKECIRKNGWVFIISGEGILWEDRTPVASLQAQDNFSDWELIWIKRYLPEK